MVPHWSRQEMPRKMQANYTLYAKDNIDITTQGRVLALVVVFLGYISFCTDSFAQDSDPGTAVWWCNETNAWIAMVSQPVMHPLARFCSAPVEGEELDVNSDRNSIKEHLCTLCNCLSLDGRKGDPPLFGSIIKTTLLMRIIRGWMCFCRPLFGMRLVCGEATTFHWSGVPWRLRCPLLCL